MQVKVKQVLESSSKVSKANKPYTVTTFLGEDDVLYKDVFGKFEVGQQVEGEWEDGEYGKKFKVARPAAGGRSFGKSPEERASIEWQSARRDALDYIVAKANLLLQLGKPKEAEKELSGAHWLEVTIYAKKFSEGNLPVPDTKKPVQSEPEPTEEPSEEIDFSDVDL